MTRVQVWERRAEVPLLLLAAAFLIAYAWPILDPRLDHHLRFDLDVVAWCVWAAFAADFAVRLWLAEHRIEYAKAHWYDVALIALPMLRPLRLLRLLAFARILHRSATRSLAERVTIYVIGASISAVGLGTLAVLEAERGAPGANIESTADAFWWATSAVTTVGGGANYPVTTTGHIVAVALGLVGIALAGSITAAIAAWFVESVDVQRDRRDHNE